MQINLHQSKSATALLSKRLAEGFFDIALIQEPWTYQGKVLGLNNLGGKLFFDHNCGRPRACVFVNNNYKVIHLVNYLGRDNVTVKSGLQEEFY